MDKNCQRALLMETSYSYIHFLRKEMNAKAKFRETCDRVHLLNILEEDLCNRCTYCKFVSKLKESLQKNGFLVLTTLSSNGMLCLITKTLK